MATTVHQPPIVDRRRPASRPSHAGGNGRLVPPDGDLRAVKDAPTAASSTGVWVIVFGISMSFAALTSALVVRKGSAPDWRHLDLPSILYANTVILLASSVTVQIARRRIVSFVGRAGSWFSPPARWLYVTLFLGLLFVCGQYLAWSQLRSQGVYMASNPSSSFFYLLTVAHALHVLGGLTGLTLVIWRLSRAMLRRSTLDIVSRYWHFMDLLWLYLLILLKTKL